MNVEPTKYRAENLLLPLALFGYLAPIVTFLIAIANIASETKIAVLAIMVGAYTLFFILAYKRFSRREDHDSSPADAEIANGSKASDETASFKDLVTGLPNLTAFRMVLEHELAESARAPEDRPLSVVAIEIRKFSSSNETRELAIDGESARRAAAVIKGCLRAMDFAARNEGQGFLVVLPGTSVSGAEETARRITNAFSNADQMENPTLRPNIGIVTFSEGSESAENLILAAASKLREARERRVRPVKDDVGEYLN